MKNRVKHRFGLEACRLRLACRSIITITFLILSAQAVIASISLPQDANGWTIFTPSSTSRLCYVATAGNDSTAQYYAPSDAAIGSDPFNPVGPIKAYATYAAAAAVCRNGYDDWILFKRGDTFVCQITPRSGASATQYALVGAYGASGAMPVINPLTQTTPAFLDYEVSFRWFALIDLDFYSVNRDPASPSFTGVTGERGLLLYIDVASYYITQFLVEGCKFRFFYGNEYDIRNGATAMDLVIRRTMFLNMYSDGTVQAHGLWMDHTSGSLLEECIFDHNGWYSKAGSGGPGQATIFQHSTYFSDCHNVDYKNNILLRASSTQTKFISDAQDATSNITLEDNLWIDGEQAISLGGNYTTPYRFQNIVIKDNVITNIDRDPPTNRNIGWGMDILAWDTGSITGNLLLNWDNPAVNNTWGITIEEGSRNVAINNNVVWGLNPNGTSNSSYAFRVTNQDTKSNITVLNNAFQEPNHALGMIYFQSATDLSGFTFGGNTDYAPSGALFTVGSTNYSFSQWKATSMDTSSFNPFAFPDPTRNIERYMSSIGQQASIDAFITACRAQGRYSWDSRFTADAVNSWIRAGFMVGGGLSGSGSSSIQPPSGLRLQN